MASDSTSPTATKACSSNGLRTKRASLACQNCRQHKVKCSLAQTGAPCQRCRRVNAECTAHLSKRSREYRQRAMSLAQLPAPPPLLLPRGVSTVPTSDTQGYESIVVANLPNAIQQDTQNSPTSRVQDLQDEIDLTPHSSIQFQSTYTRNSDGCVDPTESPELPSYISPTKHIFDVEEIAYLRSRGALSVPLPDLRDQLLLAFLLYVHPFLPVVDFQDVCDAVEGRPGCQISLLLFQAIMFAGTAFVDLQHLLDAGFENRLAARAYFFRKIKLLYDFEYESDRVVMIQATLLHAWWWESTNDQQDPWYWLGIILTLATGMGLNRAEGYASIDEKTCRLWRRLWWTIASRDRLAAITTRKPLRIPDEDLNLEPLKFQDFDTKPLDTRIPALRNCPLATDCVSKVMLADMFMSKLRLLLIMGRAIVSSYALQRFAVSTSEWAIYYRPKRKCDLDLTMFNQIRNELDQWSRTRNSYCRMKYHEDNGSDEMSRTNLRIHAASLELLYMMAVEILNRPLTSPRQRRCEDDQDRLQDGITSTAIAIATVSRVMSEMSDLLQRLREQDLLCKIPPVSVSFIMTAMASLFVDIRMARKQPNDLPNHQYHECIRSLLAIRGIWPITSGACTMIKAMETNSQIWYARNLKMLAEPVNRTADERFQGDSGGGGDDDRMSTTGSSEDGYQQGRRLQNDQDGQDISRHTSTLEGSIVIGPGNSQPQCTTTTTTATTTAINLAVDDNNYGENMDLDKAAAAACFESLYPFPLLSADFDLLDTNQCPELFLGYSDGPFEGGMGLGNEASGSVWPSSPGVTSAVELTTSNGRSWT